jgi:branched-subunit amino acid transport protein
MKVELVGLAVLMFVATYPSRAIPLLSGQFERLSPRLLEYLRLVGPAVLAALAAKSTFVTDAQGPGAIHVGIEWLAVPACLLLVVWRRNLFVGLVAAVVLVAAARAAGLA